MNLSHKHVEPKKLGSRLEHRLFHLALLLCNKLFPNLASWNKLVVPHDWVASCPVSLLMSSVAAFSWGFGRAGRSKETLCTCVVVLGSFPQGLSHLSGVEASKQCSKRVKGKLQVLRLNSDCTTFVPLHSVSQPSQRPLQIQEMEKTDSINRLPLIMIIDYHYCQIQA